MGLYEGLRPIIATLAPGGRLGSRHREQRTVFADAANMEDREGRPVAQQFFLL
jgi:hypothetical protein